MVTNMRLFDYIFYKRYQFAITRQIGSVGIAGLLLFKKIVV